MKTTNIIYWISTGLFAFVMLGSAVPDFLVMPMAVEGFTKMGMPTYLLPFLGWAKVLGVIAILVPEAPRIREWAYAGLIFDLIGATYSVAASGEVVSNWAPMILFTALGFLSYAFHHKRQRALAARRSRNIVNTSNTPSYAQAQAASPAVA